MPSWAHNTLSDTTQSLHDYLDRDCQAISFPAGGYDGLSESVKQMTIDMERIAAHADTFEEAAIIARKKAQHMQSTLSFYKNLSIPLVQMPPEVLALVFERCVEIDTGGHVLSSHAMPWVLSQTCRRWRSIALSTPSLWQIVRLDTNIVENHNHGSPLDMLQTWLERSQPLPISCFATLQDVPWEQFNRGAIDLLIHHASRWRAVDFCFGTQSQLFYRLRMVDPNLPLLQSIRLEIILSETAGSMAPHWIAPNLKEATLFIQNYARLTNPVLALPWSQLEEFEWSPNTPKMFFDLSPTFDNLRYCFLKISHHGDVDGLQRYTLPKLRRLDTSGPYRSIVTILNRLTLPSLECLDVDTYEQIGPVADQLLSCIARLQMRSTCRISSLSAPFPCSAPPNHPYWLRSLELSTSFASFSVQKRTMSKPFPTFYFQQCFGTSKVLHLIYRELPGEEPSLLSKMVQMVESRNNQPLHGVRRLDKLSLDVIRPTEMPVLRISTHLAPFQRLLQLQRGGLILLGSVVDGRWHSYYGDGGWNDEDFRRSARRWARFGYSDWLYEREVEDYLKVSGCLDSH
ncbi:hypothetical protein Moror_15576 [Moniliophthora roreri MCA 2997]|uniref:Uncharacterized protein n=1 Tax=Moniliophthora roreri (strain MCA 2997) TaxID=1381753 RepID=V2W9F8_MONRO|nr:hypothetical protein Moror_15576 [Moniliophthora roreri MCA 2997]